MPSATLWLLDGGAVAQDELDFFAQRLGSSETRRLASFLRPQRRRQFLLGRMLLRFAVAELTGTAVDAIDVVERPGNAPRLSLRDAKARQPNVSVSHSRDWVACVASCEAALGLDIEVNDPARDIQAISEMVFPASALSWLSSRSDGERVASCYGLWCEAEALHKLLCNIDRRTNPGGDCSGTAEFRRFSYLRQISGVTVVTVSERRLSGIREKTLTGLAPADWMRAAQHPGSR
jgi:4'-phosphopantetheinyl transferase